MAIRATRRVAHHDKTFIEQTKADDPRLAIVPALIFNLEGGPREDVSGVFEVQTTLRKGEIALGLVVGDAHGVNVDTKT